MFSDCGTTQVKHLSYAKAIKEADAGHPRMVAENENGVAVLKEYPLSTDVGHHGWEIGKDHFLYDYSVGMVLYFRFIKILIIAFIFLSLCSIPSILLVFSPDPDWGFGASSGLDIIATSTIGNLGAAKPLCAIAAQLNESIVLDCPIGTIGQVWAYHAAGHYLCIAFKLISHNC